MNKVKNVIITVGFILILLIVFITNIFSEDKKISVTERRALAQLPDITVKKLIAGDTSDEFEKYTVDQFVFRDSFRSIKSFFNINILGYKDNNELFIKDNAIYKIEYPLNKNNVKKSGEKIQKIYEKYLKGMNVYYAIIPDKNYYLNDEEFLRYDYNELKLIIQKTISNIKYINIWDCLKLEDYYRTDTHWKQENLINVVNKIEKEMNLKRTTKELYNIERKGEFYGVYYGQLGLELEPDKINILTNDTINNCKTYNLETNKVEPVYNLQKFKTTNDKYDIYLSGASYLIEIENSQSKTDKELLLFRDSYGSSIAPLLIENYKKITLIDTRYISSNFLDEYIEFENQDVLFLYSSLVLNQNILK